MSITRRTIDFIILIAVIVTGFFAVQHAQTIGDWWYFLNYEPSAKVGRVVNEAGMSEKGEKLFYRFNPQFVNQSKLDEDCSSHTTGCSVGNSIFILDTGSNSNETIVTAAHEMLHIAYSRFNDKELRLLHNLIDKQIQSNPSSKTIDRFEEFESDLYYNEAHAYLGTEEDNLISELESHYMQFFTDRNKTLKAFERIQ